MRRAIALAAFLLVATLPGLAIAAPVNSVTLKNGDVARGIILELIPGDHVTVQLASGESRAIPWDDVDSIADVPEPPPKHAPPSLPGARVHLVANDDAARLARDTGLRSVECSIVSNGSSAQEVCSDVVIYKTVCAPPCDKFVSAGTYHVIGAGLRETGVFSIPDHGAVRVDAHMRANVRRVGGLVLLFSGLGISFVGGIFVAFGVNSDDYLRSTLLTTGGVMLGVGALALGLGIWLTATSSSSATVLPDAPTNTVGSVMRRGFTFVF